LCHSVLADVPPAYRIFRDNTASAFYVVVQVEASEQPPALDRKLPIPEDWSCRWSARDSPQILFDF
jgi:hypothetical protein